MNNVCDMAGQGAAYAAGGAYAADGVLSVVSGDADAGVDDVPLLPLKEKDVPFRASRCQAQPMAPCPDKVANTIPFVGSSYDVPQAAVPYQDVLAVAAMGDKAARVFPDADATKAADLLEGRLGYRFVKRLFDVVFSLLVFALLWWLFLVVAVAIKLDSPGPVLFNQERVGKDGRTFKMYKFRSMFTDAEDRLESLQSLNEKDGPVFKIKHDPRVTRVGRFIRKTSLDELPQFLNVLLGNIPLRILKTRPEFSEESMGAFALPAKSSTNKGKVFSQVASCFANGLRMRRISLPNCSCIGGMKTQFLAKPVFGVSPEHSGALFQKSNNGLAEAAW